MVGLCWWLEVALVLPQVELLVLPRLAKVARGQGQEGKEVLVRCR